MAIGKSLASDTSFLKSKLTSRKFWVTVSVGTVVVFGRALGINLDEAQLYSVIALASTYIGVQGYLDSK